MIFLMHIHEVIMWIIGIYRQFSLYLLLLLLSRFSHVRLCDPIDGSPSGSPIPGILQARTLEWVAISFSNAWKWKVKVKSLICVRLLATPWTAAHQAPPSMGFSREEYGVGCHCLLCELMSSVYLIPLLTTPWLDYLPLDKFQCICSTEIIKISIALI